MTRNKELINLLVALAFGIVCAVIVGCEPPTKEVLSASEKARLGAWLALHIAKVEAAPAPAPKPDTGDVCPDCNGEGKVGDGTVFRTCLTCGGTGKRKAEKEDPELPRPEPKPQASLPKMERYAIPPKDGRTFRKVCRNGECAWEPVQ